MNSFQQPNDDEPGGATWHKVADPAVGWFQTKNSSWTADSFSGGLTIDFSSLVPVGTRAVRIAGQFYSDSAGRYCFWRKGSDSNIANTPNASAEWSHILTRTISATVATAFQAVVWLSATYTADFAVSNNTGSTQLDIAYPLEYLL